MAGLSDADIWGPQGGGQSVPTPKTGLSDSDIWGKDVQKAPNVPNVQNESGFFNIPTKRRIVQDVTALGAGVASLPDIPATIASIPGALINPEKKGAPFVENLGAAVQKNPFAPKLGQKLTDAASKAYGEDLNPKNAAERERVGTLQGAGQGVVLGPMGVLSGTTANYTQGKLAESGVNPDLAAAGGMLAGGAVLKPVETTAFLKNSGNAVADSLSNFSENANTIKNNLSVKGIQQTFSDIQSKADGLYKQARNYGVVLKPESTGKAVNLIEQSMKNVDGVNQLDHPRTFGALNQMKTILQQGNVSLDTLESLRRRFNQIAYDSKAGDSDKMMASSVIKNIDRYVSQISEKDILSGDPKAIETLKNARSTWAASKSYEKIANIFLDSEGDVNKIKKKLNNLIQEKASGTNKKARGFTTEEVEQLKKAANTGNFDTFLKMIGKLGLGGSGGTPVFLEAAGALAHQLPIATAGVAGGTAANMARSALTRGNLSEALTMLKKRALE